MRVNLQRNGHGRFGATYHLLGSDTTDTTVRQPIAIAKEGLRIVFTTYWADHVSYDIWHVSRDGAEATPFALDFGKPGGMVVQKLPE